MAGPESEDKSFFFFRKSPLHPASQVMSNNKKDANAEAPPPIPHEDEKLKTMAKGTNIKKARIRNTKVFNRHLVDQSVMNKRVQGKITMKLIGATNLANTDVVGYFFERNEKRKQENRKKRHQKKKKG